MNAKTTSGSSNATFSNITVEEQISVFQGINFSTGYNSNTVILKSSPASLNYTFTLPTSSGTPAQVLTTDGAGNMYWGLGGGGTGIVSSVTASGPPNLGIVVTNPESTPDIVFTPLVTGTGNFVLASTPTIATPNITGALNLLATTRFSMNCLNLTTNVTTISCGSSLTDRNCLLINFNYVSNSSDSNYASMGPFGADIMNLYPSTGVFTTPTTGTVTTNIFQANVLRAVTTCRLNTGSANTVTIDASAATTPYSFRLPVTAGTAGQVLTSQAASAMTWTTPVTSVGITAPTWLAVTGSPVISSGTCFIDSRNHQFCSNIYRYGQRGFEHFTNYQRVDCASKSRGQ